MLIENVEDIIENFIKIFLSYRAHASTMLSVLHVHLLVLVSYFATRSAPFARIHKLYIHSIQLQDGNIMGITRVSKFDKIRK